MSFSAFLFFPIKFMDKCLIRMELAVFRIKIIQHIFYRVFLSADILHDTPFKQHHGQPFDLLGESVIMYKFRDGVSRPSFEIQHSEVLYN